MLLIGKVEHLVEVEVEAEGSALCGAEGGEGHAETVPGGGEWWGWWGQGWKKVQP